MACSILNDLVDKWDNAQWRSTCSNNTWRTQFAVHHHISIILWWISVARKANLMLCLFEFLVYYVLKMVLHDVSLFQFIIFFIHIHWTDILCLFWLPDISFFVNLRGHSVLLIINIGLNYRLFCHFATIQLLFDPGLKIRKGVWAIFLKAQVGCVFSFLGKWLLCFFQKQWCNSSWSWCQL